MGETRGGAGTGHTSDMVAAAAAECEILLAAKWWWSGLHRAGVYAARWGRATANGSGLTAFDMLLVHGSQRAETVSPGRRRRRRRHLLRRRADKARRRANYKGGGGARRAVI